MNIGNKIKNLRTQQGLTQEELAGRCELSKGFISQIENNLTSPSISTLMDILLVLGTDLHEFFNDSIYPKVVYSEEDVFVQKLEDHVSEISWLIPNAQKHDMEPMLIALEKNGSTREIEPHFGEIFIYVLEGMVTLILGENNYNICAGESAYLSKPRRVHTVANLSGSKAKFLLVSSPPLY
jgi:transcriptional regulator with XRE-family HTH domain